MNNAAIHQKCAFYLDKLCRQIPDRSVGSPGNREATRFFEEQIASLGWITASQEFDALDWHAGDALLAAGGLEFEVLPSPYANGCDVEGRLVGVENIRELEVAAITGKIVLLHGEIAGEQLMPKNFVFYNPEEHQRIIALLESGQPLAIVCATGRNPALAGGVYPFPLIEDGDFDIPSVYMTAEEGARLRSCLGQTVRLRSDSRRIPGKGWNVTARQGSLSGRRVVVTAHIDAKKGTPGAIDNATGVAVLLLLAELLSDYRGQTMVEIVAFNGEDYYAVPGQMLYLQRNQDQFDEVLLNVNIDGAGYCDGSSAYSFYDLPEQMEQIARAEFGSFAGLMPGEPWYQGDHSIFVQAGRPAIAITSAWFAENIENQDITHTPKDNLAIVDVSRVVEIAQALATFVRALDAAA